MESVKSEGTLMSILDHSNALAIRVSGFQPQLDAPQSLASLQETKIVQLSLTGVFLIASRKIKPFLMCSCILKKAKEGSFAIMCMFSEIFSLAEL